MPKATDDDRIQIVSRTSSISRHASLEVNPETSPQLRHRPSAAGPWQPVLAQPLGRTRPPSKHLSESFVVIVACLAWVAASSGAILINKHIMVDLRFSYPGAVAAVGMLGTTIACSMVCLVLKLVPLKAEMTPRFYLTYIMPTGFFMAVTFQAGNLAYLYLSGKSPNMHPNQQHFTLHFSLFSSFTTDVRFIKQVPGNQQCPSSQRQFMH